VRVLVAIAAITVFATGCGSEDESATTTAGTGGAPEAQATEPFGAYERNVTQAEIEEKGETDRPEGWTAPLSGIYRLTLNEGSVIVVDPDGLSIAQEASVSDRTLNIGRYIGSKGIGFCADDAPASYAVEATADELVLSATSEECGDREAILAGTWTKSSDG